MAWYGVYVRDTQVGEYGKSQPGIHQWNELCEIVDANNDS